MQYNPKEIEENVQKIWSRKKIPDKIVKFSGKNKFYLLDGPPYVNAAPHVGHVKTTTFKDVWGKFKAMQGFSVWFQPGFDCGGLPIENAVEKKLKIKSKQEIEKLGIDRFIEECNNLARGNESVWLDLYKKIGAWRGWLKPYLTSENYYIESGWWTFKKIFEKNLLFKGKRPGFWCSHCETVLSGYEVTDSYKDLEDISIFIKFPVKDKEYLLVFTTTPWTLPANVALCVHPDEDYVKVLVNNEKLILAERRLEIFDQLELKYRVLEKFPGKDLDGLEYKPLLDIPLQKKLENTHRVLMSIPIMKKRVASKISAKKGIAEKEEFEHLVTMDVGTGIVHIAPGHGDSDNKLGKYYKLPEPSPVNEQGRLTEEAGEFSGYYVKEADPVIIEKLREKNLLLYSGRIVHSYPLCWRCKTPLIYRMSEQWFLAIDKIRDSIIRENEDVRWLPDFASERFKNILLEAPDWAITRSRYWGIPIPIWVCEKCGEKKVIGSERELRKESIKRLPAKIDLHKNIVDKILLRCRCSSTMIREKDIMDVWFDSGISPWASLGYPFKNKILFKKLWPVDLIDESTDQTRGWFYSLMVTGFSTFSEKPYKTVCLNGWTLDEKGEKMSKSLGNVVFGEDAYEELGADLLRLYCCYDVAPWETQKFSFRNAKDLGRSLNILWNTYNFFRTYCKIEREKTKLKIEDRWILSLLNSMIKTTTKNMENFNFNAASRDVMNFIVNDFSRTYIKLIRDRKDKAVNYALTTIFDAVTRLMAPITPFVSEYIYHEMNKKSVHLSEWPKPDEKMVDKGLEKDMLVIDEIVNNVNIMRKENKIKLRWPLPLLVVDCKIKNKGTKEIMKRMCNVKNVKFGKDKKLLKKKFPSGTVYLDTNIIGEEALLRELLREIQEQRKKNNLTVKDSIILYLDNDKMKKFSREIKERVGANKIVFKKTEKILGKVLFNKDIVGFYFEKTK